MNVWKTKIEAKSNPKGKNNPLDKKGDETMLNFLTQQ